MPERSVVMAKFEYTVKFNGRKYLPGEEVPMDEPKAEPIVDESPEEKEPVLVKSKGRKKAK